MNVPKCLVIIPDGNRRWARANKRKESEGHTQGLLNCRLIAEEAFHQGVQQVVIWAVSESNLERRSPEELSFLYHLLKEELLYRRDQEYDYGFRLCGLWEQNNPYKELPKLVAQAHRRTLGRERVLTLLFGYSGKTELLCAVRKAAAIERIDPETIRRHLWTAHVPDVDLVIRTGVEGDPHWSDLLLPWQISNAQLHFNETCWPAFTRQQLREALEDYGRRTRRLGA